MTTKEIIAEYDNLMERAGEIANRYGEIFSSLAGNIMKEYTIVHQSIRGQGGSYSSPENTYDDCFYCRYSDDRDECGYTKGFPIDLLDMKTVKCDEALTKMANEVINEAKTQIAIYKMKKEEHNRKTELEQLRILKEKYENR